MGKAGVVGCGFREQWTRNTAWGLGVRGLLCGLEGGCGRTGVGAIMAWMYTLSYFSQINNSLILICISKSAISFFSFQSNKSYAQNGIYMAIFSFLDLGGVSIKRFISTNGTPGFVISNRSEKISTIVCVPLCHRP